MKPSETLKHSVQNIESVTTTGQLRTVLANSLLAIIRKEVTKGDVEAMAKAVDAISNNMNAEVKMARTRIELRAKGANLGDDVVIGKTPLA